MYPSRSLVCLLHNQGTATGAVTVIVIRRMQVNELAPIVSTLHTCSVCFGVCDATLGVCDGTLGVCDGTPGVCDGTPGVCDGTLCYPSPHTSPIPRVLYMHMYFMYVRISLVLNTASQISLFDFLVSRRKPPTFVELENKHCVHVGMENIETASVKWYLVTQSYLHVVT